MQNLVSLDMKKQSYERTQRHAALIEDDMEHCCTPSRYNCISDAMQQLYDKHPPAQIQTLLLQFREKCQNRPNSSLCEKLKALLFID